MQLAVLIFPLTTTEWGHTMCLPTGKRQLDCRSIASAGQLDHRATFPPLHYEGRGSNG